MRPCCTATARAWVWSMPAAPWACPVENSVAIGDSENDLDMFRHAGWSVAMGNASPAVQSQADWVTAPAGQGGIARALAHIGI